MFLPLIGFNKIFLKIRPDIIHAHLQATDLYIALINLLSFNKYNLIRTVHNPRKTAYIPAFLDKYFYNLYPKNIACSDFVKNNYENIHLREYLQSIPNGIDISRIEFGKTKAEIRERLGIPANTTVF